MILKDGVGMEVASFGHVCRVGWVHQSINQGGHGRKKKFMGYGRDAFYDPGVFDCCELITFLSTTAREDPLHAYPLGRWWLLGLMLCDVLDRPDAAEDQVS